MAKETMTATRDRADSRAVPLSSVPQGSRVRLAALRCGRALAARLRSMGLRAGVEFSVVKSGPGGPLVVGLGNARVALGRGMAHKMMVVGAGQT